VSGPDQLQSPDRDGFNPRRLTSLIAFRVTLGWTNAPSMMRTSEVYARFEGVG